MQNPKIDFIINIAKFNAILSKTLEGSLGGLGMNDFIVLYNLNQAPNQQLRRIDLAEKTGLSASGVTRLLLPMEKIGLITKETNTSDARVSLVRLAPGGKMKYDEALERLQILLNEKIANEQIDILIHFTQTIQSIGGKILWK